jgi:D-serine deaminase-like pyridoxal phosphate-dependent protein
MPGHGALLTSLAATAPDESLLIERLSEEHATVRVLQGSCALKIGDLVRVVPNHSCVVSNLVDSVWIVAGRQPGSDDGDVEILDELPVAARGRIA